MDPKDPHVDARQVVEELEGRMAEPDAQAVGEAAPLDAPAGDGAPDVPGTPEPPD